LNKPSLLLPLLPIDVASAGNSTSISVCLREGRRRERRQAEEKRRESQKKEGENRMKTKHQAIKAMAQRDLLDLAPFPSLATYPLNLRASVSTSSATAWRRM
jgi:hypothetical protein